MKQQVDLKEYTARHPQTGKPIKYHAFKIMGDTIRFIRLTARGMSFQDVPKGVR